MDSNLNQDEKPTLGKRILHFPLTRIIIGMVMVLVPVVAVRIAIGITGHLIIPGEELPDLWKIIGWIIMTVLVILSYRLYVRKIEKRPLSELSQSGAMKELAIGCVIGFGLMVTIVLILWITGYYRVLGVGVVLVLLVPFFDGIFTGFFEEIVFRGIIFRIINNSLGSWPGIIISALIFGFAHAANPNATLFSSIAIALEAGILISAVYLYTHRLWMVIGLHFAWNFTLGGIFGITVSGVTEKGLLQSQLEGPALLTGGVFGTEASILTVIICLLVGFYFLWEAKKRGHFTRVIWNRSKDSMLEGQT